MGAVLANGPERITTYIKHRMEPEAEILRPFPAEIQSEISKGQ